MTADFFNGYFKVIRTFGKHVKMSCIKYVQCVRSFRKITRIKKFPQIDIWSASFKLREQCYSSSTDNHDKSIDQGEKSNDKSEKLVGKREQSIDKNEDIKSTDKDEHSPEEEIAQQMRSRFLRTKQKIEEIRHKIYTNTKILVPFHVVSTLFWFGVILQLCYSEVDMIAFLNKIDLTSSMLTYFKDSRIGELTVAFFILKITKPLRYGVSLAVTLLVTRFCEKYGYEVPDIFAFVLRKLQERIEKQEAPGAIEKQKEGRADNKAGMNKVLNATPVDADIRPATEQDSAMNRKAKPKKAAIKKKVISNLVKEELTKIIEEKIEQTDKLKSAGTNKEVGKIKSSAKASGAAKEQGKSKQIESAEDNKQTKEAVKNDKLEEVTKGSAQEVTKAAKHVESTKVKSENVMKATPEKQSSVAKQTGTANADPSNAELNAKQMTTKQQPKSTDDATKSGKIEDKPAQKTAEITKQTTKIESTEDRQLNKNAEKDEQNKDPVEKPPDNRRK